MSERGFVIILPDFCSQNMKIMGNFLRFGGGRFGVAFFSPGVGDFLVASEGCVDDIKKSRATCFFIYLYITS